MASSLTQIQPHVDLSESQTVNYLKSCPYPRPTQVLLSVKPEYASSIFKGEKGFEFRKTGFRRQVDTVVVYVTSPVQKVLGEFDVDGILHSEISSLWERTREKAGISEATFFSYFGNKEKGYAIEVGGVRCYSEPLDLKKHFGVHPPQSFIYLDFPWPKVE